MANENTTKKQLAGIEGIAKTLRTTFDNLSFTSGLHDTPSGYLGHSGDYLIVNDNESGIHFTGIEKIASDLTDYGFSAGETTFTGLSDTPSDFTAGKYLRVNDAGDALEYVDITGVSSGGGGGQIHATFSGSTGEILTKSSNWDTYVDSITFPQGSWNGYLRINYKNNFTTVPTILATADHRENVPNPHVFAQVQAQSGSSCDIVIGDTERAQVQAAFNVVIFSDEIAGGGGDGSTNFVSLTDTPVDYIGHSGDYLVVNGGESGINFTGIEKIAQDLTDYGFGNGTFTGLVDTPSTYETGKFIGVTNDGNIEYIDIELLKNIADAPEIEIVSGFLQLNDQRELVWGFPPSPEDNGDVNYAISGATHFTGLLDTPTGYTHNAYIQVDGDSKSLNYVDINKVAVDLENIGAINQPQYFTGLNDTPSEYDNGKFLVSTENGLDFIDIPESVVAFTGLNDTPGEYDNGKFLVSTENGLGFTDVPEPIVAFTGLSDTPSDFTAGKYLRVNDAGDALEYVDITGVSSGGSNGSSNQCGISSLELTNSHPSADSIEIAIPDAIIAKNTFNNDQILSLEVLTNNSTDLANNRNLIYTSYGTQYIIDFTNDANGSFKSSTGIVAAHQQNLKWFIDNGRALYYGSCGGSGGNYEFCKSYFAANQTSPGNGGVSPIDLNSSSLETQSQDWTFLSPTYNKIGIKIPTDGLYNIVGEALIDLSNSSTQSDWLANVVNHAIEVKNENGDRLAFSHNNKAQNNGDGLKADIYAANVYLTAGTILTVHSSHYRVGGAGSYVYRASTSYLNVEKAGAGGSGGTGGSGSSGGSATSYIDSVVTKAEDGPIDKRSTDTTASGTNYYRVPVESLRFDDLEVGATYRISVRLKGYASSDDIGAGLTIYNRASSFSSDINLDLAGIQNFNNAGGDNDPAAISLNVADNLGTTYGKSYFESKIFTATGTHLDVLASSVSQKSFIDGIRIQLEKITVGGSGSSNYEFCRSAFSSSSTIGHGNSSLDLDPNQLTTNSQDWTYTDTTLNVVGIKIPEDGLYNLNFHIAADAASNGSHWINNISFINGELKCVKLDGTTNTVISKFDSKNTGNGTNISSDFAQDNEYFNAGDFLYINSRLYDGTGGSITFPLNSRSFFSISKAGTGGGGSNVGSTDFVGLTDTPVDYIGHSGDYMIVNDDENGIHFTGIEKIAQDLTDYGFSAGEGGGGSSYFTGLLDTPNDYTNQAGKYVRVSQQEDGLDFIASSELLGLGTVDGYDFCADFHLQSDTTNNSSSFQDLSYDPYSVGSQNVIHSTSITPIYGSSSLYFNGDARLSVGDNSTFSTLSKKLINNYTVQFWINPAIGSQNQPIMGTAGQSTDHGFRILLRSDNKVQFDVFKGLTNDTSVTLISSSAININSWTHVALINNDNVLTFYINGTSSGSINWTKEGTNITPTYPLLIGGLPLDNVDISYLEGYMQDIRIDRTAFNTQYFPPQELTVSQCNANQSELTFSSLKDTPVNYSNAGGKYVRVSENESQLEYVGITVAGSTNNEFSNSFLTQNITGDEVINELSYGGLDVGKTYRLTTTLCLNADGASDFPKVDFYNGDRKVISLFSKGSTSTVSNSMLFIARDENIFASGRNLSSTAYVMGDPEISFMQLELPPSIAVELDEEVILPPSTGAGGIFSIADIKSNAIIEDKDNLLDFSQIVEDLNEEIGGPTGVMLIGDIKLNTIIEKGYELGGSQELFTGVQVDENGDPVEILKIADVKANAIISQDHDLQSNFTGEMPLFSVLNIGDMKTLSTIQQTGIGDNQTVDFPTGAFDWQNI